MIHKTFIKHTLLSILGTQLFVYLIDVLSARYVHAHKHLLHYYPLLI